MICCILCENFHQNFRSVLILHLLMSVIAFVIVIAVCVVVHEYGHYITAKILGVQVHEFAFGMGLAILQRRD